MNVTPYAIDQRIVLGTGEMQNFLVIRLPGGKETRAPIDLETMQELLNGAPMAEVKPQRVEYAPPEEPPARAPAPPPPKAQDHAQDLVRWQDFPPDVIHPYMKEALMRLGVSAELPVSTLESLIGQINERFGEEDWDQIAADHESRQVMAPAAAPPPAQAYQPAPIPPPPAPPLGTVQWSDGRPVVPSATAPGRTIQKDEMGYPLPQAGEVDPGELVGGSDLDEDGVGQL